MYTHRGIFTSLVLRSFQSCVQFVPAFLYRQRQLYTEFRATLDYISWTKTEINVFMGESLTVTVHTIRRSRSKT